ncbi:MAG TPA: hypothetical protein VMR34_01310 [Candidatus Saccharimonadales bacterium]|nr:hypothetical protein [Candidatus Saccharimonadales bacterium]
MTVGDPSDKYPVRLNPVEVFSSEIGMRQEQLVYLAGALEEGMELIGDINVVNELLAASSRPDLVMSEPVEQMPLNSLRDINHVNNFIPSWTAFGVRVFRDEVTSYDWEKEQKIEPVYKGRRPFTDEERARVFLLSARGGYEGTKDFAAQQGFDNDFVRDMILQTHIDGEAFLRMWILMPELTERLMSWCLDEVDNRYRDIDEEIFVAYSIMSRLVDRNDHGALKDDGTIDTWLLCH